MKRTLFLPAYRSDLLSSNKTFFSKIIDTIKSITPDVQEILLHGSRATNEYRKGSDWDFLVFLPDHESNREKAAQLGIRGKRGFADISRIGGRLVDIQAVLTSDTSNFINISKEEGISIYRNDNLSEGEVVSFKPKHRARRHEIEVLKLARIDKREFPWVVFMHGQYFNAFKDEKEANKFADNAEKEWDRSYTNGFPPCRIVKIGKKFSLLDRGVRVGIYDNSKAAIEHAKEIDPDCVGKLGMEAGVDY